MDGKFNENVILYFHVVVVGGSCFEVSHVLAVLDVCIYTIN